MKHREKLCRVVGHAAKIIGHCDAASVTLRGAPGFDREVSANASLSMPMTIGGALIGVLNIYSEDLDGFDGCERVAAILAGAVATSVVAPSSDIAPMDSVSNHPDTGDSCHDPDLRIRVVGYGTGDGPSGLSTLGPSPRLSPPRRDRTWTLMPEAITEARQRVLDVASQLFGERGYGGTSLQAISDRLGFTKAALYYHFQAKNDILAALAGPVVDRLERVAGDSHDVSRPAGRRVLVGTYLDALVEAGTLAGVLLADPTTSGHVGAQRCRSARTQVRNTLAAAGSPPIGTVGAACCLGALHATVIDFPDTEPSHSRSTILAASMRALGDPGPRQIGSTVGN